MSRRPGAGVTSKANPTPSKHAGHLRSIFTSIQDATIWNRARESTLCPSSVSLMTRGPARVRVVSTGLHPVPTNPPSSTVSVSGHRNSRLRAATAAQGTRSQPRRVGPAHRSTTRRRTTSPIPMGQSRKSLPQKMRRRRDDSPDATASRPHCPKCLPATGCPHRAFHKPGSHRHVCVRPMPA